MPCLALPQVSFKIAHYRRRRLFVRSLIHAVESLVVGHRSRAGRPMKLQLSLRDLFWLVLVGALACGWWVERTRLITEVERLTYPLKIKAHRGGIKSVADIRAK